jgi:hypothetical protein
MLGMVAACRGASVSEGPAHTCISFEGVVYGGFGDPVDLLFVVDNSPSMGDKAALLTPALSDLLNQLVNSPCVDFAGNVLGPPIAGKCPGGSVARAAPNLHVAIVSSSLGGYGSDRCSSDALGARENDRAESLNRVGSDEHSVGDADPSHFLAWFPSRVQALSQAPQPDPALTDSMRLVGDFTNLTGGVHTSGCAFEASLESWYRFLVEPDPYEHVDLIGDRASPGGIDVIAQLVGADLDDQASCEASPKAGWCVQSGWCVRQVSFSPAALPIAHSIGALITVACSEGC